MRNPFGCIPHPLENIRRSQCSVGKVSWVMMSKWLRWCVEDEFASLFARPLVEAEQNKCDISHQWFLVMRFAANS